MVLSATLYPGAVKVKRCFGGLGKPDIFTLEVEGKGYWAYFQLPSTFDTQLAFLDAIADALKELHNLPRGEEGERVVYVDEVWGKGYED